MTRWKYGGKSVFLLLVVRFLNKYVFLPILGAKSKRKLYFIIK